MAVITVYRQIETIAKYLITISFISMFTSWFYIAHLNDGNIYNSLQISESAMYRCFRLIQPNHGQKPYGD